MSKILLVLKARQVKWTIITVISIISKIGIAMKNPRLVSVAWKGTPGFTMQEIDIIDRMRNI